MAPNPVLNRMAACMGKRDARFPICHRSIHPARVLPSIWARTVRLSGIRQPRRTEVCSGLSDRAWRTTGWSITASVAACPLARVAVAGPSLSQRFRGMPAASCKGIAVGKDAVRRPMACAPQPAEPVENRRQEVPCGRAGSCVEANRRHKQALMLRKTKRNRVVWE